MFERDPETEFEFRLAMDLSMTVDELRERMSNAEFTAWRIFYARIAQREEVGGGEG